MEGLQLAAQVRSPPQERPAQQTAQIQQTRFEPLCSTSAVQARERLPYNKMRYVVLFAMRAATTLLSFGGSGAGAMTSQQDEVGCLVYF